MAGRSENRAYDGLARAQRCRCLDSCYLRRFVGGDTAGEYKDIDSKILLFDTMELLRDAGYTLGNIDATVAAERPKLNPHIPEMKRVMADVLQVDVEDISIKATTTEKLGFTGRQEGIAAYATVLIQK